MSSYRKKRITEVDSVFTTSITDKGVQCGSDTVASDNHHLHQAHWKKAYLQSKHIPDPWEKFHIDENFPDEIAIRHRYSARKGTWVKDEVHVRMEEESFDRGAMRVCFRAKKLSNFTKIRTWKHAGNHVAKRYIEEVSRETYFSDVILQMDAKLWGEEYNRHFPPKKVDILQISILEMKNRTGSPLFHTERFIEGKYIKYNSNSGYIHLDDTLRATPQAFSHFTFERSNHKKMVVDIQGVGDLYTDPQIHCTNLGEYGEANLGTNGMALFFSSHRCNKICDSMALSPFDLSELEMKRMDVQSQLLKNSQTLRKELSCLSVFNNKDDKLVTPPSSPCSPASPPLSASSIESDSSPGDSSGDEFHGNGGCFFGAFSHRSSAVASEISKASELLRETTSVLGEIHFVLAKMNEAGRFSDKEPDQVSAMFHLKHSAACIYPLAVKTQAQIFLQIPHDTLSSLSVEDNEENRLVGFELMETACDDGDREAMLYMAHAHESGNGLGSESSPSWSEAILLYEGVIKIMENQPPEETEVSQLTLDPLYKLYARVAEMYSEGGHGMERDPQKAGDMYTNAAEQAMNEMKGKLANKYYALAEEAWGELE